MKTELTPEEAKRLESMVNELYRAATLAQTFIVGARVPGRGPTTALLANARNAFQDLVDEGLLKHQGEVAS